MFFFFRVFHIFNMWTTYKKLFNGIKVNTIICVANKSHYEALNISKTATHKEIKDAYYRLSMIYHPDKNKGSEEAAKNFRDITSAYEILGNVRQRKLYDSGFSPNQKTSPSSTSKPFRTMNTKNDLYKANALNGDYNFDEWSKLHYSKVYQRQSEAREMLSRKKQVEEYVTQQRTYISFSLILTITCFVMILMFENVNSSIWNEKSDQFENDKKNKK